MGPTLLLSFSMSRHGSPHNTSVERSVGAADSQRTKVGVDEKVPVELTPEQRDLILKHTLADPDLTAPLEIAPAAGKKIAVGYTLSDIEELMGFIAAEANHTSDRKLETKLDHLWQYLQTFEDQYEDELSAPRT